MSRIAICFILACSLTALGVPAPKQTKQDLIDAELAKLQGTWQPVYYQRDGVEAPLTEVKSITIKGKSVWSNGIEIAKITEIDPTASPTTIEYQILTAADNQQNQKGIYKVEGDSFIECVVLGEGARPKEFVSKAGSGHHLLKFKRAEA